MVSILFKMSNEIKIFEKLMILIHTKFINHSVDSIFIKTYILY